MPDHRRLALTRTGGVIPIINERMTPGISQGIRRGWRWELTISRRGGGHTTQEELLHGAPGNDRGARLDD